MYGGKLEKVKFRYTGDDIDAILDRLPTAKVLNEEDGFLSYRQKCLGMVLICGLRVRELKLKYWRSDNAI